MKKLLLIVFLIPLLSVAQSKKQRRAAEMQRAADEQVIRNLKAHIQYLSDDKLEGRSAGSNGEKLAAQYISEQFKAAGLTPKGTNGFLQEFAIVSGKVVAPSTYFKINGSSLQLNKEYFPLPFSANASLNGAAAIALREAKEPWFMDVKDLLDRSKDDKNFDIHAALQKEASAVAAKGATALIIFNSSVTNDNIRFNKMDKSTGLKIPVVYVMYDGYSKYLKDKSALLDIEMNVEIGEVNRSGTNVIGYIDNNAPQTVVIGAHYDHLGFGDDANSLDTGRAVRNGADDNASGIAALIELAQYQKQSTAKNNNYVFIAFSGEELGLLGSKYWLDHPTVTTPPNYMINLDMIGRYDDDRKLTIGGFGTSPEWKNVVSSALDNKIKYRLDSVGAGPSDHASFYRKDIPVLFFFTGNHTDYHKASDDYDKINIEGEFQIVKLVNRILEATNNKGKLAFQRTAEPTMLRSGFAVSLGVIPDYSFEGPGLRISGVSPKKTAESIGMAAGDILMQLGDFRISDMNSYMQALSTFKKGDRAIVRIKRGPDEKVMDVEF